MELCNYLFYPLSSSLEHNMKDMYLDGNVGIYRSSRESGLMPRGGVLISMLDEGYQKRYSSSLHIYIYLLIQLSTSSGQLLLLQFGKRCVELQVNWLAAFKVFLSLVLKR